ncbi:hypothetical protein [Blastomonas sp.]|uniref:hypothetical protein n=1 Tax=Blastomonas sp. TaxID=1909299 RepID=UPI00406AA167
MNVAVSGGGKSGLGPSNLSGYLELVGAILKRGYTCTSFDEFDPTRRHLILRHDVDIDLECAVKMAQVEAAQGWCSTYFVLLGSEFYNLFSAAGRAALAAIVSRGHTVALHFDRAVYPDGTDLEQAASSECAILAGLIDAPVRVTAAHRPGATWPAILGASADFAGRAHAYQARYFREAGYVADSAGHWLYGHPLDHPALLDGVGLQLLTHPYLWTDMVKPDRNNRISARLLRRAQVLEAEAMRNFSGYTPESSVQHISGRRNQKRSDASNTKTS